MPRALFKDLFKFLRWGGAPREGQDISDGALVERFLAKQEESAFEALLERHGPMVLAVCQRVVGDVHAAEDAFQATFFVLARRAAALRKKGSVGSWLHGVALRIACRAREKATARRDRERRAVDMPRTEPLDELTLQELRSVLDEEIGCLPEKYRAAVVLCYLEGKSYEQAAQELGWAKSSLASRLAKARDLLRVQLTRRGLALSAGALALALAEKATAAPVAALLTINIVKAATIIAAGKTLPAGILTTRAIALSEEAMKSIIGVKGKLALFMLVLGLAVGAGLAGHAAWVEQASPKSDKKQLPQVKVEPGKNDAAGDPLPAGAVARLGSDRWLHDVPVRFAAFLPDGKAVVTVSIDYAIRVWEFPSGKEIRRMQTPASEKPEGGTTRVHAALSKDGKTIATCNRSDGEIYLHDIATGKRLPGLKTTGVTALAFSPDETHLASMEIAARAPLATPSTVRIWDWAKAKEVRSFAVPGSGPTYGVSLAYAPDGKTLGTACEVRKEGRSWGEIKLWNPAKGAEIRTLGDAIDGPIKLSLAFSPDGKTLAFLTGQTVTVTETGTGKPIRKLPGQGWAVGFDGRKIYTGPPMAEWDVESGKLLRRSTDRAGNTPAGIISLSPDGNTLLAVGRGPPFFDLKGKDMTLLDTRRRPMVSVQWTSEGKNLLTHSAGHGQIQRSVQTWDAVTGKELGKVNVLPEFSNSIAISPDGEVLASARDSGSPGVRCKVLLIEMASGKELGEFTVPGPWPMSRMVFSPDGKTLAIGRSSHVLGSKIILYDVPAGKLRHTLQIAEDDGTVRTLIFSPDSNTLAARADALNMGLWDTATGKRIGSVPLSRGWKLLSFAGDNFAGAMPAFLDSAAFFPDGRSLVVDMDDGTAVLYELATGKARRTFGNKQAPPKEVPKLDYYRTPDEFKAGTCFAFSPDGTLLARAGFDRIVRLYDVQSGRELAAFKGHVEAVTSLAFAPDGKTLASSSLDSTALTWDVTKVERPAPDQEP